MPRWFTDLQSLQTNSTSLAQSFDAEAWTGAGAAAVVETTESIIRSMRAVQSLAAHRVEVTNGFVESQHADASSWMASTTGTSKADAARAIATGRRMSDLPAVDEAYRSGRISPEQAERVAHAGEADPTTVPSLLRTADTSSLHGLEEETKRIVAAKSASEEARVHERQRRRRRFGIRTDADGCVNVWATLLPEEGAELEAAWRKRRNNIFLSARRSGRFDSYSQYDADSFMSLIRDANATGGAKSARVQIVIDFEALKRGHRRAGETCEIPGVGEVSVATCREYLRDAWFELLVTQGRDVRTITSKKRYVPAMLASALQFRDRRCAVSGCQERLPMERDHRQRFADGGATSYDNVDCLCRFHHSQKTYKGYGFVGEGEARQWMKVVAAPGDPPALFNSA